MTLRALGLLVTVALLAGCLEPPESVIYVQRITAVPVSMTAKVEHPREEDGLKMITLSENGAMGLGCTEYCAGEMFGRNACEQTIVTVTPPSIASVREAFLLNGREGATVLVAGQPGVATLEISSPCVTASYRLVIEPF